MESLFVGLLVGSVVFVIYLVDSAKRKEIKDKQRQAEFSKRLEELNNSLPGAVSINENPVEKKKRTTKKSSSEKKKVTKTSSSPKKDTKGKKKKSNTKEII